MCFAEKYGVFAEKHGTFACLAPNFVEAGWLAERRPRLEDGLAALDLQD